jgi:hypothetical protein
MKLSGKIRILVVLLLVLIFGLITTVFTDCFTKDTTSPTNIVYSADQVLYFHAPLLPVTQSKKRGFPFISQTKIVTKYTNEGVIRSQTWVQLPAISSTGSNSLTRILLTWQFYADVLVWMIVWSLFGYSIKLIKRK